MNGDAELTPGLQCCLRCGRVLTDRALHDSMEESMLYAIRARHPEWALEADKEGEAGGECQPCLSEYRRLLSDRRTRAEERLRVATAAAAAAGAPGAWMPSWVNRILSRTRSIDARV